VTIGALSGWQRVDSGPSRFFEQGYQLEWSGQARQATEKPIVVVGRFTDPDRMAEVVRGGTVDLIGAARPSISDPFLPRKIEEGRYDEVRECIGCNACYSRSIWGRHLGCTQNATAGEEHRRGWHPERFDRAQNAGKTALVVGAGPAGMECAIVLAKRGLELVHLVDADDDIGGCLQWVTRLPGLGEWGRLIDYRRVQMDRLENLQFVPGLRLDAAGVREYGADIAIIGTGARWNADGTNGITRAPIAGAGEGLAHVLTPEQVMVDGLRPPGSRVCVIDYEGYFTGAGIAEVLRAEGREVELLTCFDLVAHYCDQTLEGVRLRRRLHDLGIGAHRGATATGVDAEGVGAADEFGRPFRIACDGVIMVTQRRSDDALHRALADDSDALAAAGVEQVHAIGDCVAPRLIADAIFDGHRLAREIDSPDPSRPLPYLRERPLV
jgi:dimethylamine/trimethylamine dehydrogenase